MRKNSTPERRVGRAANITIFLGILFTLIHLLATNPVLRRSLTCGNNPYVPLAPCLA